MHAGLITSPARGMLSDELESLFGQVPYPGDKALADSYPNEWDSTIEQLHGKDWRTVGVLAFDSQGGIVEGIQALSAIGFIYFLPGLVRIALAQPEDRYLIVSALLTRFTHLDRPQSSCRKQQEIIERLSSDQRNFLSPFFAEMQTREPLICSVLIGSARRNLAEGKLTPYTQNQIDQWMSQIH